MSDKTHERWMVPMPLFNTQYNLSTLLPLQNGQQTAQWTLAQTVMSSQSFTTNLLANPDQSSVPWPDSYTVSRIVGQIYFTFNTVIAVVNSRSIVSVGIVEDTADVRGSQTIFNPQQYLDAGRHWKFLHHIMWNQATLFNTYVSNVKEVSLDVSVNLRVADLNRLSLCVAVYSTTPLNTEVLMNPYVRVLASGVT